MYAYNNISNASGDVDDLLEQYDFQKKVIMRELVYKTDDFIDKVWKNDGYLIRDNYCQCKVGSGDIYSPFSCYNCKNLSRLTDFKSILVNSPFQIECGDNTGLTLCIEKFGVVSPKLSWDENVMNEAKKYLARHSITCGTPKDISSLRSLRGDPFTIQIMIKWLIEKVFDKIKLTHILKTHNSFICSNNGYNVREHATIGNFKKLCLTKNAIVEDLTDGTIVKKLNTKITKGIILQLLSILKTLSIYNFSHGTPSYKSLLFGNEPVNYKMNDLKIVSPVTVYINNFNYSSMTVKNIHLSSKTTQSDIYLKKASFTSDIATKSISNNYCENEINYQRNRNICDISNNATNYYKLTNDTLDVYTNMRHIGFPLFVGSFDFYCFLVSLMCCKKFYNSVHSDEKLHKFWTMLWSSEDILVLEERIKIAHDYEDEILSYPPYDLIKGLWLRCNVIDYCWNIAKEF